MKKKTPPTTTTTTTMELTKEQKDKLAKLELEMSRKKEYEEKNRAKNIATSKRTGIPVDVVDIDVVRYGIVLGLIRSKDALEGISESSERFRLLDMFFNDDGDFDFFGGKRGGCNPKQKMSQIDYSVVPAYYARASQRVSEEEKIQYHRQFVQLECEKFDGFVADNLRNDLKSINDHVSVTLERLTIDSFVSNVKETIEVVMESLEDEDDQELWDQLTVLRNSLLGPLTVCEYKTLVVDHVNVLRKYKKKHRKILNHLSSIDAKLSLYSGFATRRDQPGASNVFRVRRELEIRNHLKDPELKPFSIDYVINQCNVPSMLFVPVQEILEKGLIGPYRNNPIGWLAQTGDYAFYILKDIVPPQGIRLWVMDTHLALVSEKLRAEVSKYCVKLFRVYYRACFGTNDFKPDFWQCCSASSDTFDTMINSLIFLSNSLRFRTFLTNVVVSKQSPLIPTELDSFNSFQEDLTVDKNEETVYRFAKLFDDVATNNNNIVVNNNNNNTKDASDPENKANLRSLRVRYPLLNL